MQELHSSQTIGEATYQVERVFRGDRSPRELVVEEIITTAIKTGFFEDFHENMV